MTFWNFLRNQAHHSGELMWIGKTSWQVWHQYSSLSTQTLDSSRQIGQLISLIITAPFTDIHTEVDFFNHLLWCRLVGDNPVITKSQLVKLAVAFGTHFYLVARQVTESLFSSRLIITPREIDMMYGNTIHTMSTPMSCYVNFYVKMRPNNALAFNKNQ